MSHSFLLPGELTEASGQVDVVFQESQEDEPSLEDYVETLEQNIKDAIAEREQAIKALSGDELENADFPFPDISDELSRLMELIEENRDNDRVPQALLLIANNDREGVLAPEAMEMLFEHYADSPQATEAVTRLVNYPSLAKRIIEEFHVPRRLHAPIKLAYIENRIQAEWMYDYFADQAEEELTPAVRNYLEGAEQISDHTELVALLKSVLEDEHADEKTIESAKKYWFQLETLAIGKPAPEIEGEDTNGISFKLSEYRGKVILLYFWINWELSKEQHMRVKSIAKQLEGLPFEVVGVLSESLVEGQEAFSKEEIIWRNFLDERLKLTNREARVWYVDWWPTVFLLDSDGVIRYRGNGGDAVTSEELDRAIETLLSEMSHDVTITHEPMQESAAP